MPHCNIHDLEARIRRSGELHKLLTEGISSVIDENQTRHEFIDPLFSFLGWKDVLDLTAEAKQDNPSGWRDYECYLDPIFKTCLLVIEAKRMDKPWRDLPKGHTTLAEFEKSPNGVDILKATVCRYGSANPKPMYFLATNGSQYVFFANPHYPVERTKEKTPAYIFDGYDAIHRDLLRFYAALDADFCRRASGLHLLLCEPDRLNSLDALKEFDLGFQDVKFAEYIDYLKAQGVRRVCLSFRGLYKVQESANINPELPGFCLLSYHYANVCPIESDYLHLERTFFIGEVNSIDSGIRFESDLKNIQETESRILGLLNSEGEKGVKLKVDGEWADIQDVFRQRGLGDAQILGSHLFYIPNTLLDERGVWAVVQGSSSVFFAEEPKFSKQHCLYHDSKAKGIWEDCDKEEKPALAIAICRQDGLFFGTPFHCRFNRLRTEFNLSGCLLKPIFQTREAPNFCCGHCRFYEDCPADKDYKCTKPA